MLPPLCPGLQLPNLVPGPEKHAGKQCCRRDGQSDGEIDDEAVVAIRFGVGLLELSEYSQAAPGNANEKCVHEREPDYRVDQ